MLNDKLDPVFLIIAHSLIENTSMPQVITNCRKTVRRYFAECLAGSTERINLDAPANDIVRATLDLFILHYSSMGDDLGSIIEESLEVAGVEVEDTPGSMAAMVHLNRFSGIDLSE